MPAKSKKQRRMMAIAEHHPKELYARNRSALKMSKAQLSEFAETKEKGLPKKVKKKKGNPKAGTPEGYKAGLSGQKIRSKGKGRGLGRGKGKGPLGVPVGSSVPEGFKAYIRGRSK